MASDLEAQLDHPVWNALATEQAPFARASGLLRHFDARVSPFCAVARADVECGDDDLPPGPSVVCFGALPRLPTAWRMLERGVVLQMTARAPRDEGRTSLAKAKATPLANAMPAAAWRVDGGERVELRGDDVPEMLALTAATFPGFFRAESLRLGRQLGVRVAGQLVAMAGERLRLPGYAEIATVCTRAGFTGRGFAHALVASLMSAQQAAGRTPFLHVAPENRRAQRIYERLGFVVRRELPYVRVQRD